jgi:tetratricopeptide (TPR) repeat protein
MRLRGRIYLGRVSFPNEEMARQLPAHYKKTAIKRIALRVCVFYFMLALFVNFVGFTVVAALGGNVVAALYGLVINGCVEIYADTQIGARNQLSVEVAYMAALRAIKRLPVRKAYFIEYMISNLAILRMRRGDFEAAERLYLEAVDSAMKDRYWSNQASSVIFMTNLAGVYRCQGRTEEAEIEHHLAFEHLKKVKQEECVQAGFLWLSCSALHVKVGKIAEARSEVEKAVKFLSAPNQTRGWEVHAQRGLGDCNLIMATICAIENQRAEAIKYGDLYYQSLPTRSIPIAVANLESINRLIAEYLRLQEYERAEQLLNTAYEIGRECPDCRLALTPQQNYERLLLETNRSSDVQDMKKWLREVPALPMLPDSSK